MSLEHAFRTINLPQGTELRPFIRRGLDLPYGMPHLDERSLVIKALYGDERNGLHTPTTGNGTLALLYKEKEGAVTSIAENENGEEWRILQVQGARGKKAYRVCTGTNWKGIFADSIKRMAMCDEVRVKRLTLPQIHDIEGITGAVSSQIIETYDVVRRRLAMQLSHELGMFVVDIR